MTGVPPVSLYVHWPYCSRICPYCDFNVTRDRGQAIQRPLFEAMLRDLINQAALIGPHRLVSLFFGGGTPSLLPPQWLAELTETARNLFPPYTDSLSFLVYGEGGPRSGGRDSRAPEIEITLEANPTDAEIGRYTGFRDAGVNRLSLGVQSLDDKALAFLGRNHSAAEAIRGIDTAQRVFGRVSLDLIYALPGQTVADWRAELTRAAGLGVEHISPYQLTIEPATAFGRAVRRGRWSPPGEDLAAAFYEETQTVLDGLGFDAYEISNHARGKAAHSIHNVFVWRGNAYIGIGPGAHGRIMIDGKRSATTAFSDLKAYADRVARTGIGYQIETLSPLEIEEEAVMLGLRTAEGIRFDRFRLVDLANRAAPLIDGGFLTNTDNRLHATAAGRPVLDRLLMELLA